MSIKKFNEMSEDIRLQPKVKHLIEYLSKLDPEMEVGLDKDGWVSANTELEMVENTYLFDTYEYNGVKRMIINN